MPAARALVALVVLPACLLGQDASSAESSQPSEDHEGKRIFWVIPNFRTSPTLEQYKSLSPKEKFKIATLDGFDRGTIALAAAFAGEGQITNSERSFGQGVGGYARYFGAEYADFVIGDYMTEAIYPVLLHQDPRYFRKGKGSGVGRLGYAVGQIFWTHHDSGRSEPNYSEVAGNATAVAISMAYYPGGRNPSNAAMGLGTQLAVDTASNVLKEFWPDIERKLNRKHRATKSDVQE